jgi:hypothetical protein
VNRPKRSYALYRRPTRKGRSVYYAKFRDPETLACRSFASTGCTRRVEIVLWCERHLAERRQERENPMLSVYVKSFWLPAAYAQGRTARDVSMSRTYLAIAESNMRTHLIPAFG